MQITRLTYNSAHLRSTKESLTYIWTYHGIGGTGPVEGGTDWFLVVLGQYGVVLGQYGVVMVRTWWYWVSIKRNWLIHDGTWSIKGDTGQ